MQPQFASIDNWSVISGLGRTKTYYLLAEGHLRAVKAGKRTLVDVQHGLAWLRAQPVAEIRAKRASAA